MALFKRLSQLAHDWMRLNMRTTSKFIHHRSKDAGIVAKEKVHARCIVSDRCAIQTPRIKRCVLRLYEGIARLNASFVRLKDHIARYIVRPCDWLYDERTIMRFIARVCMLESGITFLTVLMPSFEEQIDARCHPKSPKAERKGAQRKRRSRIFLSPPALLTSRTRPSKNTLSSQLNHRMLVGVVKIMVKRTILKQISRSYSQQWKRSWQTSTKGTLFFMTKVEEEGASAARAGCGTKPNW